MDKLVKATASDLRIFAATTTSLTAEAARRHQLGALGAAALGRVMTGALLLAANLKNKEAITVSFGGNGVLGKVVADAVPEGYARGYVQNPTVELPLKNGKLAVGDGIGQGLLTITRFTNLKDPVSGSVEIKTGEIAEDITHYLYYSEQTPSAVSLGVLVAPDKSVKAAGGFLVQPLPEATSDTIDRLEKNIAKLRPASAMIADGYSAEDIIRAVFAGFDKIDFLSSTDLAFRCQCSKRRTEEMIMSLRPSDRKALLSDGQAEVYCQFCGAKYNFNLEELTALDNVAKKISRSKEFSTIK